MRITPSKLASRLSSLPERLAVAMVAAESENLRDAVETARRHSQGPFKTAELRQMYNPKGPYSKADPHPPADPGTINDQGGPFARSWETEGPAIEGGVIRSKAVNTDPKGKWLAQGTPRMIARDLPGAVVAEINDRVEARREKAIKESLGPLYGGRRRRGKRSLRNGNS